MLLSTRIKLAVLVWLVLEILAFSLVAHWIGAPRAILLGVITSLLGLTLLRRAGTAALLKLRARMGDRLVTDAESAGTFLDEMLATVGALALLLPGFLSDIVGLALAAPALRERAVHWVRRKGLVKTGDGPRHGPTTIDLEPDEWRHDAGPGRSVTKPWSS